MDIQLVIVGSLCLAAGVFITWLLVKNNAGSELTEWRLKKETAEQSLERKQKEADELLIERKELQINLSEASRERAALVAKVEMLMASVDEAKERISERETGIGECYEKLTAALQVKVATETELFEAKKVIAGLQERESLQNIEIDEWRRRYAQIESDNSSLKATDKATKERLVEQQKFVIEAQTNLRDAFGALSAEALKENNTSFVELAKATLEEKVTDAKGEFEKKEQAIGSLVKPLSESLEKMDTKIKELEGKRIEAYTSITGVLNDVKGTTEGLKKETANLVGALKTSHTRGRYGELRCISFAGQSTCIVKK